MAKAIREVTIRVPQGLGDIFWCFQKFVPHFDRINVEVCVVGDDPRQTRALPWLEIFPKIGSVTTVMMTGEEYGRHYMQTYSMKSILDRYDHGETHFGYAVNWPMEHGTALRDVDPGIKMDAYLDLIVRECPIQFTDYVCVYISGDTLAPVKVKDFLSWSADQWREFLPKFMKEFFPGYPIIFIGAEYDRRAISLVSRSLPGTIQHHTYIDGYPSNVCWILQNAKFFVGYQSGLNIIANNFDMDQLMLWFPKFKPMWWTFCNRGAKEDIFFCDGFDKTPEQVIDGLYKPKIGLFV